MSCHRPAFVATVRRESWKKGVSCDCKRSASYATIELFDAGAVLLDDLANMTNLFEFGLQFVDLAEDLVEAGYLGVGVLDQSASAIILHSRGRLCLLVELRRG